MTGLTSSIKPQSETYKLTQEDMTVLQLGLISSSDFWKHEISKRSYE